MTAELKALHAELKDLLKVNNKIKLSFVLNRLDELIYTSDFGVVSRDDTETDLFEQEWHARGWEGALDMVQQLLMARVDEFEFSEHTRKILQKAVDEARSGPQADAETWTRSDGVVFHVGQEVKLTAKSFSVVVPVTVAAFDPERASGYLIKIASERGGESWAHPFWIEPADG